MIRKAVLRLAAAAVLTATGSSLVTAGDNILLQTCCDASPWDEAVLEEFGEAYCDSPSIRSARRCLTLRDRIPSMIGDYFSGEGIRGRGQYNRTNTGPACIDAPSL